MKYFRCKQTKLVLSLTAIIITLFSCSNSKDFLYSTVACGRYHTVAIKTDGTLWAWGYNKYGQLGLGDNRDRNLPAQVGVATDWAMIACGNYHTIAIKKNGTLWASGLNMDYQLGFGNNTDRNSFMQMGTDADWSRVACGARHTIAIKTDGTLWAWGSNSQFQFGLGDNMNRKLPVQIGANKDWSKVTCGEMYTIAIKTDGTLWAWGNNEQGQLGLGDSLDCVNLPTQVGTSTDWTIIACGNVHTAAIKTDGTLWVWGYNSQYQLGLGDDMNRKLPVQIGTSKDWSKVDCGAFHTVAVKIDGTLWAWGMNNYGQLGVKNVFLASLRAALGSYDFKFHRPIIVEGKVNCSQIICGTFHTVVINTDGTLWICGNNEYGQLGR